METKKKNVIERLADWYLRYIYLSSPEKALVVALWTAATQAFEAFDAFPYLTITARIKRCGKTRLAELISFTANMPAMVSGASAAALYRMLKDDKPTILWDEAETLSSEAATLVRQFLNVGYRKGQTIPRATADGVIQWPTYCPKVFILIGDVYDTLRDRSIVIEMQRGNPKERFLYERAKAEGLELHDEIRTEMLSRLEKITEYYETTWLRFLSDRDEEIWRPLFAIAKAFGIETKQIERIAADLYAEKTADRRSHTMLIEDEDEEIDREFSIRLLEDLIVLCGKEKGIFTANALEKLYAIPTAPWRKFRGSGLTADQMGALCARHKISPRPIRIGQKVLRGYHRIEMQKAIENFRKGER